MRAEEVKELGKLGAGAFAGPATLAREVHRAAAGRIFGALGLLGTPVRVMHDSISRAVYWSVGSGLKAPLAAGAGAVARTVRGAVPMADSPGGGLALAALNGAIGDTLAREQRELALELSIRRHGRAVDTDGAGLAEAFPDATPKLAVFVHGLCESEDAWRLRRPTYGSRLRDDLGYTPVYVRYNSGLHVSDNGRRLADVLEQVLSGWPVGVDEIALVGHSMGGLVARSACHYGKDADHDWTGRLRHVFCLGTPHLGAPLERAANVAGWTLGRLAETRPFADVVNGRSAGIKDLRYGNLLEDDWCDCDPDEFLNDRCCEVPFLPNATYYFVGATLTRDTDSRLGGLVGDLLVQLPSASGQGPRRHIPFEIDNGLRLGGLTHFDLLSHPAVYDQMRARIDGMAGGGRGPMV
jgi:pimeloyl-ACP methyl ester carboxylesterase